MFVGTTLKITRIDRGILLTQDTHLVESGFHWVISR